MLHTLEKSDAYDRFCTMIKCAEITRLNELVKKVAGEVLQPGCVN
jgi:hypothetical protein